jgi:CelD/BcsL family acetyltransferase involved in cellulose biosynthesis
LVWLGGIVTDYNAPLVDPRFAAACTINRIDRLWQAIVTLSQTDIVWLLRMPANFPDRAANPMAKERHAQRTGNAYAATLPATLDNFVSTRSRTYFAGTRRARRKLERLGSVRLEMPATRAEIDAIAEAMLQQKTRRFAETGAPPLRPWVERFYRTLVHVALPDGQPHAACLRVDGEIVATHVGAMHRNCFYWLMPGFEAAWSRYSVGRLMLYALVEWCIMRGLGTIDLTVGDEHYKRFWADHRLPLFEARYARNARGGCLMAGWRMRELLGG